MKRKTVWALCQLALLAVLFGGVSGALADDSLSLGTTGALPDTIARLPVYIRDANGTPLGMDQVARIQSINFGLTFTNEDLVVGCTKKPAPDCQMTFTPAGVLEGLQPLKAAVTSGTNTLNVKLSYDDNQQPIHYTLDAPAPGNLIGYIEMQLAPKIAAGSTMTFTVNPSATVTVLADNLLSGTVSETVGSGLSVSGGTVTISECTIAPTQANVSISWSGGCTSPSTSCPSAQAITFTANARGNYRFQECDVITWSFSDGFTAAGPTVTHTPTTFGALDVALTVTSPAGTVTVPKTLLIFGACQECGSEVPSTAKRAEPVTFRALLGSCPSPTVHWTFGDGGQGTGQVVQYTFATTGTMLWHLTVDSGGAGECEKDGAITITNAEGGGPPGGRPPGARPPGGPGSCSCATAVPNAAIARTPVTFFALDACDAVQILRQWTFGDQTSFSGSSQSVQHTYAASGTYQWTLSIISAFGPVCTASGSVNIADPAPPRRRVVRP